jgi:hypothetical protein
MFIKVDVNNQILLLTYYQYDIIRVEHTNQIDFLEDDYDVELLQRIAPNLPGDLYNEAWRIFHNIREIKMDMCTSWSGKK